jgi:purine-binding chemotaxis protein CheW
MKNLFLIAVIAGERIVLAADDVESVVEIEAITPVPRLAAHVAGLAALRSRVLTMIDCRAALGFGVSPREGVLAAVVVTVEGYSYGLLVDQVDDVATIDGEPVPIGGAMAPGWAHAGRAMVPIDDEVLLLVDPAALVSGLASAAA